MSSEVVFVDREFDPHKVFICQEEDQPPFYVLVRRLPVQKYQAIFSKLQRFQGAGFRKQKQESLKVDKEYLEEVVEGWEGCTIPNWLAISTEKKAPRFRDESGKDITEAAVKAKREIPFSQDLLFRLYTNSWPDQFGNEIFKYVKGESDKADAEDAAAKKE